MPSGADSDWLQHLQAAAQVRVRRRLRIVLPAALAGAVVVVVIVIAVTASKRAKHPAQPHDMPVAAEIAFLMVSLGVCVAFVFLLRRLRRTGGFMSVYRNPPLAAGLPTRRERRAVRKAVMRGTPNPDPTLRALEIDLAWSTNNQLTRVGPLYPLLTVLLVAQVLVGGDLVASSTLSACFVIAGWLSAAWTYRRTKRYLRITAAARMAS